LYQPGRADSAHVPKIRLIFVLFGCTMIEIQTLNNSEELMSQEPMMEVTSDDKLWAALSYVFAPIVGIIVLLMEDKKNRPFIKFNAVQSIAVSIAFWIVATIITTVTIGFGGLCVPVLWLVFLYWAYQAYQGQMVNIPIVTNFIKGQGWA
jgi:uncharacterized membrane protein